MSARVTSYLAVLLASVFVAIGLATAGTASASSFSTGLIDIDAFQGNNALAFERTKDAGAKYVKNNVYWGYMVGDPEAKNPPGTPAEPFVPTDPASPYYDWSMYDEFVRNTVDHGLQPILTLVTSPRWARASSKCIERSSCAAKPDDYADFATAAAKRYSGTFDPEDGRGVLPRVKHWQAWVEPNLYLFFEPIFNKSGTPIAQNFYRPMLNEFYDAVHAVNDDNVVISAGQAPNAVKNNAIAPLDFSRRLLCMTGTYKNPKPKPGCRQRVKADVWATHPYTTGAPTHFPTDKDNMSVAALPRMNKLVAAAKRAGRLKGNTSSRIPLWVTEFSWDSNKPDPGGLNWNLQSRWVAQAMYMMFESNVKTMLWFGLHDENRGDGDRPYYETFESGLYLRGSTLEKDRPKKVLDAFRYPFVAMKTGSGFTYWGRTPDSKSGKVAIWGRKKGGGSYQRVGTATANHNGIFSGAIRRNGFTSSGRVYARLSDGTKSIAFGLNKTRDFRQAPHGNPT